MLLGDQPDLATENLQPGRSRGSSLIGPGVSPGWRTRGTGKGGPPQPPSWSGLPLGGSAAPQALGTPHVLWSLRPNLREEEEGLLW